LELVARGKLQRGFAEAYVAAIPLHVAQRELEVIRHRMGFAQADLLLQALPNDAGPGNAVTITLEHEHVTEVFTGFGEKGVPAEVIAERAVQGARAYLAANASVDEHLADQMLLPMALGSGGSVHRSHGDAACAFQCDRHRAIHGRKVTIVPAGDCMQVRVA
jgi:RNA 3'-terminal phosphate cyclase (ATP)